jgi:GAF domain-containing protein
VAIGLLDEALGFSYVAVFLVDEASGERVLHAKAGQMDVAMGFRLPPGRGLTERPLLDGQPHYIPDVMAEPTYVPGIGGSEVDAPIFIDGKALGVLTVESPHKNAYTEDDIDVLTSAANQTGVALGRLRLLRQAQQQVAELSAVNSISQAVTAKLDIRAICEVVGKHIRQIYAVEVVFVALYDAANGVIQMPYYQQHDQLIELPHILGPGLTPTLSNLGNRYN